MYKIRKNNSKLKYIEKIDLVDLEGFDIPAKNKYFLINNIKVRDIKIINNSLIKNLISKKVSKKYKNLIKEITDLLVDDEDNDGSSERLILDKIEKFRQEIKYKYRSYLSMKELNKMAKELKVLQKEAKKRYELLNTYQYTTSKGRNR